MRHGVAGRKFSRHTGPRLALYKGLVNALFEHEQIRTTEAKAKEARGFAEQIITLGKRGDLHARRQAIAFLGHTRTVDKVFHDIAPRYAERAGGYTRIIKVGMRKGDAAPLVQLELVAGSPPLTPAAPGAGAQGAR
jgi:large subunit ribosomal protein L17